MREGLDGDRAEKVRNHDADTYFFPLFIPRIWTSELTITSTARGIFEIVFLHTNASRFD